MYRLPHEKKRPERSEAYQYKFCEITCDWSNTGVASKIFANEKAIYHTIEVSEQILDINEQITNLILKLVKTSLTKRQFQCWELICQGLGQKEAGAILGISQTSVMKSLFGNVIYKKGKSYRKREGGAMLKIRNALINSKEFKDLIRKLYILEGIGE